MSKFGVAVIAAAALWYFPANAATITNGGFEADGTAVKVPTGWTANAAYNSTSFNTLTSNPSFVHSGLFALQIGNFNTQSIPVLSQTIATTPGAQYTISFWVVAPNSDSASALYAFINTTYALGPNATPSGGTGITITGTPLPYTMKSFTFVGTGSDVLSFAAYNNPSQYYVDDVSISSYGTDYLSFRGQGVILDNPTATACQNFGINFNTPFFFIYRWTNSPSLPNNADALYFISELGSSFQIISTQSSGFSLNGASTFNYTNEDQYGNLITGTGSSNITIMAGNNSAVSLATGNMKIVNGQITNFFNISGCNITNLHGAGVAIPQ